MPFWMLYSEEQILSFKRYLLFYPGDSLIHESYLPKQMFNNSGYNLGITCFHYLVKYEVQSISSQTVLTEPKVLYGFHLNLYFLKE